MTNLKRFIGFDVSKKSIDACLVGGQSNQSKKFTYDEKGLKALIKWSPTGSHCVMEATGPYYMKLAFELHRQGFQVSVVNPLVIKRFSQMRLLRTKTDKADAQMIASYAMAENPPAWEPPAEYSIKLQQLDALLRGLRKSRTAALNQKEAFSATGLMDKAVSTLIEHQIAQADQQTAAVTKEMDKIIKQFHQHMFENILTIPGIGKQTAIMLIVLTNGFTKFENYKQLSSYIGLCPRIFESGTSVKGKGHICKMGMSRIRALLYVCSWSAKRWNKACKELYDKLLAKGKPKRVALIAVAHKLLKLAFAIATSGRGYDINYSKNICF